MVDHAPSKHRRAELRQARQALFELPRNEMFEVAGHPTVFYELRDYRHYPGGLEEGIKAARADVGFMFKAFETGQVMLCHTSPLPMHRPCFCAPHVTPLACMLACMHADVCKG